MRTLILNTSFLLILTLILCPVFSQDILSKAELEQKKEYRSLEEALKNPLEVYKLNLKRKKLTTFPLGIYKLTNLHELSLRKNKLTDVPDGISALRKLVILNISKNKITSLPSDIGALKHLRKFAAGQNELETLPEEMGELENLVILDIWSNNLAGLPLSLANLKKLKVIDMRVIQLNRERQKQIERLLPNVKIFFSSSCNCD